MARGRPSKRAEIADVAATLFCESGYQGTSIDQVVLAAGVYKPTVYSNFPSKLLLWQDVLTSLIEKTEAELATLQTQLSGHHNYTEAMLYVGQWWSENSLRMCAYRIHIGESHKLSGEVQRYFQQLDGLLTQVFSSVAEGYKVETLSHQIIVSLVRESYLLDRLSGTNNRSKETLKAQIQQVLCRFER